MRDEATWAWIGVVGSALIACDSDSVTRIHTPSDATVAPPIEMPEADAEASTPPPLAEAGVGDASDDASRDASDDAGLTACAQATLAFAAFLSTHQACEIDADCRIINDCGPHGDSFALTVAAVEESEALYEARCELQGFDGFPTYVPRCREGRCAIGEQYSCCGCPPPDGGADGG